MKRGIVAAFLIFFVTDLVAQTVKPGGEELSPSQIVEYPITSFSNVAPPLYGWMLKSDKQCADWLKIKFKGKTLHEPINILICDPFSSSIQEAEEKLILACTRAEYLDRYGHSSDYLAIINGVVVPQFPNLKKHSFADKIFFETNNHGRIFGPILFKDKYWFCAAFSREKVHIDPLEHEYVSFNQARDAFAWSLDAGGVYKVKSFINLKNTILNSNTESSGDHDGIAILLEVAK